MSQRYQLQSCGEVEDEEDDDGLIYFGLGSSKISTFDKSLSVQLHMHLQVIILIVKGNKA